MLYEYYEQVRKYNVDIPDTNDTYLSVRNINFDRHSASHNFIIKECDRDKCIQPPEIKEIYDILEFKHPTFRRLIVE
jgi:hypothetical protein